VSTHELIEGLHNVKAMADDLLMYEFGETMEKARIDYYANLKALFQRLRKVGLRLNKD
jgi:hypothetical protein